MLPVGLSSSAPYRKKTYQRLAAPALLGRWGRLRPYGVVDQGQRTGGSPWPFIRYSREPLISPSVRSTCRDPHFDTPHDGPSCSPALGPMLLNLNLTRLSGPDHG
jgi:hypothetical protein